MSSDEIIIEIATQIHTDLLESIDNQDELITELRKEVSESKINDTSMDKIFDTIKMWNQVILKPSRIKNISQGDLFYFTLILMLAPPNEYPKESINELKSIIKNILYGT